MNWLFSYAINNCASKRAYILARKIAPYIFTEWFIAYIKNNFNRRKLRRLILVSGILFNILLIFYYKYFDLFIENVNTLLSSDLPRKNILLPLGISFFTFQQISYLVDTYYGETKEYSFLEYAAFLSFFPQLVAGPIVLHNEMIPQFREKERRHFNQDNFAHGLYIFAIGMFKKVLIADTFGKGVA